jgi:hypothetical protein
VSIAIRVRTLAFRVLLIQPTSLGTDTDADTVPVRIPLSAREASASRLRLSAAADRLARLIVRHAEIPTGKPSTHIAGIVQHRARVFSKESKLGCGAGFASRSTGGMATDECGIEMPRMWNGVGPQQPLRPRAL